MQRLLIRLSMHSPSHFSVRSVIGNECMEMVQLVFGGWAGMSSVAGLGLFCVKGMSAMDRQWVGQVHRLRDTLCGMLKRGTMMARCYKTVSLFWNTMQQAG